MDLTAALLAVVGLLAGLAAGLLVALSRRHGPTARPTVLDGALAAMGAELGRVGEVVGRLEQQRARQHGELTAQLSATATSTARLSTTASALREVLASPKARGQWGERLADDVLRAAGFVEGVSYVKQRATPAGTIPDFTFLLPRGLMLHMDAKFPVANYARFLEAAGEDERRAHLTAFVRDVRARVRELSTRGYVDPAGGTLDHVLLFLPNESIYAFVHEHDPDLLDLALGVKVVLCSPLSLFAVLAVIRQAVDAFALERTSDEVLEVLASFEAQWERFCGSLDKLGRAVEGVDRAYAEVDGTRRRALERPLIRVDELRRGRASPPPTDAALRLVGRSAGAGRGPP